MKKKTMLQKLGLLGLVSFLSYTAAVVFAPRAYPGYNWMAQAVSDLSAADAPSLALARAAAKGGHTLLLANRTPAKAAALAKELGGRVCPNAEAAETAELLFLGVKPQGLPGLAEELAPVLQARKGNAPVVVSMATAVTLRELDAMLGGGLPLIRIMPNTPAAVGAGTILYAAQNVTDAQLNAFRAVLAQAGLLLPLPEAQIDAASAISGCGPAFCFQFADALALGGVRAGLSYPDACRLAAQTMLGAAEMLLQGGEAPDVLKMRVCSPAGTTIEGVLALEQGGFSYTVQNAVTAAYRRTVEMTRKG